MERCPCCNARLREAVSCPRCKADLSAVINSEKYAQLWLSKAIDYYIEHKIERSITVLNYSLSLKRTTLAIVFRDFLIGQQCKDVLELLAKKQILEAKRQLYKMRSLCADNKQLQQLQGYTDYLLLRG